MHWEGTNLSADELVRGVASRHGLQLDNFLLQSICVVLLQTHIMPGKKRTKKVQLRRAAGSQAATRSAHCKWRHKSHKLSSLFACV